MRVERPAVIAREPRHVGRIGHNEHLEAVGVHSRANLSESFDILLTGERQSHFIHVNLFSHPEAGR